MIEATPTGKTLMLQLAELPITICALHAAMVVPPALKVTTPVGATPEKNRMAVKVTLSPTVDDGLPETPSPSVA